MAMAEFSATVLSVVAAKEDNSVYRLPGSGQVASRLSYRLFEIHSRDYEDLHERETTPSLQWSFVDF